MAVTSLHDYQLDRNSSEPLWLQLTSVLRSAISSGLLAPDQALPSEAELIDLYGVSRTVVREALAELVRRDLIYKIRAKGSFVTPPRPDLQFIGSTQGSAADLTATGRNVVTHVLEQHEGVADDEEARALQIAPGNPVVRLRRLRSVDGVPWLLVTTVLPKALFPGMVRANLENVSLYDHIRRHYGIAPAGADRWLQAVIPGEGEAEILGLEPGSPALHIESITWNDEGVRFEYYRGLHRSDESRFYVGIR